MCIRDRSRGAFAHREIIREKSDWNLHGVDVFIRNDGMPTPPEKVGKLQLSLISNRGTKIYPGPKPDIYLVDHFRLRYRATEPIGNEDIYNLLAEITKQYQWMHIEKLHTINGTQMYSKAQGE